MGTKLNFDTIFLFINNFLSFCQRGVINLNDKTLTLVNTKTSSDESNDNRTINLVKTKTTINIYNSTINATKEALFKIDNTNTKVTISKMPSGLETAASVRTVVDFILDSGDPNMFNLVDVFNGVFIL